MLSSDLSMNFISDKSAASCTIVSIDCPLPNFSNKMNNLHCQVTCAKTRWTPTQNKLNPSTINEKYWGNFCLMSTANCMYIFCISNFFMN